MAFVFKENLTAEALGHFVEQFKNKPKLTALMTAFMRQIQDLEDSAQVLYLCRRIDIATGVQLNGIGSIVDEDRDGRTDALYRIAIKSKIQINFSEGTPEDIYTSMINFYDRSYELIKMYPAAFIMRLVDRWVSETDPTAAEFASLLNKVNGAGIEAVFQYSLHNDDDTFTFASGNVPEVSVDQGFGVVPGFAAVAITGSDLVMRSLDYGATWSTSSAAAANTWASIAYGNGVWIATSTGGTNRTMRSTDDGVSWSAVAAAEANSWYSVAYGNGVWVAVATTGTNRVMRSINDGVSWSAVAAAEANAWQTVAYGNGVWVAVATTGTNRVMRSINDGLTWSAIAAPEANAWQSVAYGNGVWIATSTGGTNRTMRSTDDGVSWSAVAAAEANAWSSVAYGNGVWVAVASSGTRRVMRSINDGLTWSAVAAAEANNWLSVAYNDNTWVAVSLNGTNRVMKSDNNGLTWTAVTAAAASSWFAVAGRGDSASGGHLTAIERT